MSGRRGNQKEPHGVRFDENVHVREHLLLERQLSDRPPQYDPDAERGPGGVGTFRTYLSFEIAREYDTQLRMASYDETDGDAVVAASASSASASASGSAESDGFAPEQLTSPVRVGADSAAARAAAHPAPTPSGLGVPVTPDSASAPGARAPRRIENWHVKSDGCIYQGPTEHSSPIGTITGNLVTTRSGNKYQLGALDPQILTVMRRLVGPRSGAPFTFDEQQPLAREMHMPLLYAERVVYGAARSKVDRIRQLLTELEDDLGFPEVVAPQFSALRSVFDSLGLDMSRVSGAPAPASASAAPAATSASASAASSSSSGGASGR